jgi:L-ascorbate metabolism protein UlaG (beta-lactamase superfamily)
VQHTLDAAAVFVVTYKFLELSSKVGREMHQINVNHSYIDELKERFSGINFKRLEKINGMYITNPKNRSTLNDSRIFKETQAKRILRSSFSPLVPRTVKNKLSYFSREEDKDVSKIYKFDDFRSLQSEERYAVQNIGHATLVIQIPGFNILTDPVFYDLNNVLYPAKTASHISIQELPKIDVIVISHNHRDHTDQHSLQELLKHHKNKGWPEPKVFVPVGDKRLLESFGFNQVEEVEWYTKVSVTNEAEKTVNFISIPADHRSGRFGIDHHKSLVTAWVISPQQKDVIFKYSGDTRPLTDEAQQATDAVLWNEIKCKNQNMEIPDIICFEPSGPNYTRCDMDITHQSSSYSALLKFIEAENLAKFSKKSPKEFIQKIHTIMIHHNKFELGPDRFNEGLFVFKKLLKYLNLSQRDLDEELVRQKEKLAKDLDKVKLKANTPITSRPIIATLPGQTSLLVHAKDFIIEEIKSVTTKLQDANKTDKKEYLTEYLKNNTIFPKTGERLNDEQVKSSIFNIDSVQKYNGKNLNL